MGEYVQTLVLYLLKRTSSNIYVHYRQYSKNKILNIMFRILIFRVIVHTSREWK